MPLSNTADLFKRGICQFWQFAIAPIFSLLNAYSTVAYCSPSSSTVQWIWKAGSTSCSSKVLEKRLISYTCHQWPNRLNITLSTTEEYVCMVHTILTGENQEFAANWDQIQASNASSCIPIKTCAGTLQMILFRSGTFYGRSYIDADRSSLLPLRRYNLNAGFDHQNKPKP